ncbi:hypothetical protein AB0D46_31145 [Streptomyces sp. NPDC048383]|uniref:hypothetical protein n=1 Tax=Streptomyces sp. NPDC048383 TaxID=3155386 RepID=UPI003414B18D
MSFEELTSLNALPLSRLILSDKSPLQDLTNNQLRLLLGYSAAEVIAGASKVEPGEWGILSAAMDAIFNRVVEVQEMSKREEVIRRLNLSDVLLLRVPVNDSIPLLDPHHQVTLFIGEVPLPAAQARKLGQVWKSLDVKTIKLLRETKMLLRPTLAICKLLPVGDSGERLLREWADIYPILP